MTMKIYLAGPFFNDKQVETISRIEDEFDKYGFDYFSPRKSGGVISHLSLEDRLKESKRIYDSNISEMINANVLFAIVDGRDTGTVYEMGYFRALTDHFKYKSEKSASEQKRYSITYTNENFGLNIMLKESVDAHIVGVDDLEKFAGLSASFWDKPDGRMMHSGIDWEDHIGRRQKVLEQFQNFNPDLI
jgi:nucleoside 2-deoxyribosyltransferase